MVAEGIIHQVDSDFERTWWYLQFYSWLIVKAFTLYIDELLIHMLFLWQFQLFNIHKAAAMQY